jgi:hypothetical protein
LARNDDRRRRHHDNADLVAPVQDEYAILARKWQALQPQRQREPEWSLLPAATPPALIRLLCRCLERDLSRRLRDIAAARADVEDLDPGAGVIEAVAKDFRPARIVPWVIAAAAVGLAAIATLTQTSRTLSGTDHASGRLTPTPAA